MAANERFVISQVITDPKTYEVTVFNVVSYCFFDVDRSHVLISIFLVSILCRNGCFIIIASFKCLCSMLKVMNDIKIQRICVSISL